LHRGDHWHRGWWRNGRYACEAHHVRHRRHRHRGREVDHVHVHGGRRLYGGQASLVPLRLAAARGIFPVARGGEELAFIDRVTLAAVLVVGALGPLRIHFRALGDDKGGTASHGTAVLGTLRQPHREVIRSYRVFMVDLAVTHLSSSNQPSPSTASDSTLPPPSSFASCSAPY